jgi:hypothetical protein
LIRTSGATGGNPYLSFEVAGVAGFSMGIDNSDDNFKIVNTGTFTPASAFLTIDKTNNRLGILT